MPGEKQLLYKHGNMEPLGLEAVQIGSKLTDLLKGAAADFQPWDKTAYTHLNKADTQITREM